MKSAPPEHSPKRGDWDRQSVSICICWIPDGSSLDLCSRLREYAPHTPILFYSGDVLEADVRKGLAAGATDYVTKPYFADLNVTVKQAIEQAENSIQKIQTNAVATEKRVALSLKQRAFRYQQI